MAASILYGVATYFYYEKMGKTMRSAIVSNLQPIRRLHQLEFSYSDQNNKFWGTGHSYSYHQRP